MPIMEERIKSMVVWLVMAALCGLIGFLIVLHYASQERPSEHFAIVVDAGSTQTRSSLYRVTINAAELDEWRQLRAHEDHGQASEGPARDDRSWDEPLQFPLGNLVQVRQVSSCINGGPLAAAASAREAGELVRACLIKFARHIELLDFVDTSPAGLSSGESGASESDLLDAHEVSRQLALTEHRVNSVTHMHLGATAGMRALEQLNGTRAREKLHWIDEAIGRSNELMLPGERPFINKGFVGIIRGSDEASFGWISVNFVCDTLRVHEPPLLGVAPAPNSSEIGTLYQLDPDGQDASRLDGPEANQTQQQQQQHGRKQPHSIGILELGGASAQMAFQVADGPLGSEQVRNMSLAEQQLSLFNGLYRMATRSDLCLGMSQAVLRLQYVDLHKTFAANDRTAAAASLPANLKLTNSCMQRGSRVKLTGPELAKLWQGACLQSNGELDALQRELDSAFRAAIASRKSVELLGTGEAGQCGLLLDDLVNPTRCKRYFALCPSQTNRRAPPPNMPFVTISGFNHALNVLGLRQAAEGTADGRHSRADARWQRLRQTIDSKLGGGSIDYAEFVSSTSAFCSTNSSQLLANYPKVNAKFQNIICLQLVYIRKLLTEFYQFEPSTSWSQIKFLIFAPKSVPSQFSTLKKTTSSAGVDGRVNSLDARRDIGWTLGLLLNATSHQLDNQAAANQIYFHHGASIMYIVRATILMMFACCLIAIGVLVAGVIEVRKAQNQGEAYISHSSSSSSYDVSYLAPTPLVRDNSGTKATALKYVLSSSK